MAARPKAPGLRFLDLPLEIRLEVYGHYFKRPAPVPAFDSFPFHSRPPPLALVCRLIHEDLRQHIHELYGRRNVIAIDNMYQALTSFVAGSDDPMRRTIRHIRFINLDLLCSTNVSWLSRSSEYLDAWIRGQHSAFDKMLQSRNRGIYFETIPDAAALSRISRHCLPNLETLTLDIGRIDHLGPSIEESWLEEAQHVRDQRYRVVIQKVRGSLPADVPRGLSITIKARMDPIEFVDGMAAHIASQRPVLNITLTYDACGDGAVQIVEDLPEWQTVQDGRLHEIDWMVFPEISVRRLMAREVEAGDDRAVGVVFSQGYAAIPGFHT